MVREYVRRRPECAALRSTAWLRAFALRRILTRRPDAQMFQDALYHVRIVDQRDGFHRPVAARTHQRIDFIDLVDQARPGRSGARRDRPCILGCLIDVLRRGCTGPLAAAPARISANVLDQMFEPVRDKRVLAALAKG